MKQSRWLIFMARALTEQKNQNMKPLSIQLKSCTFFRFFAPWELLPQKSATGTMFDGSPALKLVRCLQKLEIELVKIARERNMSARKSLPLIKTSTINFLNAYQNARDWSKITYMVYDAPLVKDKFSERLRIAGEITQL